MDSETSAFVVPENNHSKKRSPKLNHIQTLRLREPDEGRVGFTSSVDVLLGFVVLILCGKGGFVFKVVR